jgi:ubiquitin carboxyl-terminal hydrolase 10
VRRKKKHAPQLSAEPVELPTIQQALSTDNQEPVELETPVHRPETPSTSHPPSDQAESTNPTTPSSVQHPSIPAAGETTPVASKATRSAKPAVPIIPAIPKSVSKDGLKPTPEKVSEASQSTEAPTAASEHGEAQDSAAHTEVTEEELKPAPSAPKAWSTPKSWTGLFNPTSSTTSITNTDGHVSDASNFGKSNEESLAEALTSFNATSSDSKVTFLEPRGLVNTGNMCYMNSVS